MSPLTRFTVNQIKTMTMLHHNELITIEEETLLNVSTCRSGMQRKFTLTNQSSKFSFGVLTSGGSIVSIKVNNGTHEIVLPTSMVSYLPLNSGTGNSNSCNSQVLSSSNIGSSKRDLESYPLYSEWTSHVLGSDTLLLTTSSSQSLIYQLTSSDEFIVTGKLKNCHAMAPFYFNLNHLSSTINGHFVHLRCLDSIHYEIVACQPPATGSNYNTVINQINVENNSSTVNSTTCNNLSTSSSSSNEQPSIKFDIINGATIVVDDHRRYVSSEDNLHECNHPNQSSLIQDTVYTVVPVFSCNSTAPAAADSASTSSSGNVKDTRMKCVDKSCETPVNECKDVSFNSLNESSSHTDCHIESSTVSLSSPTVSTDSRENCCINKVAPSTSARLVPSSSSSASSPIEAPVLVLTLSYAGRSIEMSLQCNSNGTSGNNHCSLGNNLSANYLLNSSPYSSSSSSSSSSSPSPFASASSSTNAAHFSHSPLLGALQYELVKLRVRIRKDGISFMPVGMSDFKCIYKVKW